MTDQLTAAEAARRLGVKPATLYAYVSRGVLTRRKDPAGRTSRYDAQEIEDLAPRGRPRRHASPPRHRGRVVPDRDRRRPVPVPGAGRVRPGHLAIAGGGGRVPVDGGVPRPPRALAGPARSPCRRPGGPR